MAGKNNQTDTEHKAIVENGAKNARTVPFWLNVLVAALAVLSPIGSVAYLAAHSLVQLETEVADVPKIDGQIKDLVAFEMKVHPREFADFAGSHMEMVFSGTVKQLDPKQGTVLVSSQNGTDRKYQVAPTTIVWQASDDGLNLYKTSLSAIPENARIKAAYDPELQKLSTLSWTSSPDGKTAPVLDVGKVPATGPQ